MILIIDVLLLFYQKKPLVAERTLPEKWSNGDANKIFIQVTNKYFFPIFTKIIDEIPFQFQERNFLTQSKISSNSAYSYQYSLTPKERGVYHFGSLNVFAISPIGFVSRKLIFQKNEHLPCYPSFIHLRKYELMALNNEFLLGGIKKIRKLGHTMEFEQIKDYVQGDDVRTINWKATSKQNKLMVNQYQDEKAQRVITLIDKGRTMQMPFDELSLLDYSINACMALSHIILKKGDKAGLLTFSNKIDNKISAEQKLGQLKKISEALYNVQTDFKETDFGKLHQEIKFRYGQRSLLLLFTNFETLDAVNRQMKYLRSISKNHLLVVVFFKNSELQKIVHSNPENLQQVYDQIIAEKFDFEKKLIIQELRRYGIYSIYTLPENLNLEIINKYLEIKSRGII